MQIGHKDILVTVKPFHSAPRRGRDENHRIRTDLVLSDRIATWSKVWLIIGTAASKIASS